MDVQVYRCTNVWVYNRVGVKYSTWYLYLSTYLSVLDVLEYLVYGNAKVLVLDQKVLGTYKYLVLTSNFQVLFIKKCKKS